MNTNHLAMNRLAANDPIFFTGMVGLLILTGCAPAGPATHPVAGSVTFPAGDVSLLAGHTLEVALTSDPFVRAAGEIQADGSFTLQSPRGDVILAGAPAGDYQARIVLSDDDSARRSAAAKALPARYLEFQKSGLALRVPAERAVTLELKRR